MLTTETAKRGRWIRVRGILIRVREFGLEDVVYEWKMADRTNRKRADVRDVDEKKPRGVQ